METAMTHLLTMQALLAIACGSVVGFSLALIGGGGSILAVPLLLYVVGVHDPHQAIGTSLFAVGSFGLTAATNYAISGLVDWPVAAEFIGGGIVGGWLGALGAKRLAKTRGALNIIFALAIIAVAILMLVKSLRG
jgi:uncharacterized membrane protein YfcA